MLLCLCNHLFMMHKLDSTISGSIASGDVWSSLPARFQCRTTSSDTLRLPGEVYLSSLISRKGGTTILQVKTSGTTGPYSCPIRFEYFVREE